MARKPQRFAGSGKLMNSKNLSDLTEEDWQRVAKSKSTIPRRKAKAGASAQEEPASAGSGKLVNSKDLLPKTEWQRMYEWMTEHVFRFEPEADVCTSEQKQSTPEKSATSRGRSASRTA